MRKDAEEAFAAKHTDLLKARGFTGDWEYTAYEAMECLNKLSSYLQNEEKENDLYFECMATLQNNFHRLSFRTPAKLTELSARLRQLMEEPTLPDYKQPLPDNESILGLTERDERLAATEKYIVTVKGLCREMDHEISMLKDQGPCFSPFLLEEQEQELLRAVLKLAREKNSFGGFSAWVLFPHFSSFIRSHDLLSQARVLKEKEQKALVSLALLSAVLYLIISAVLDGKPLEKQVIIDLQQAVYICENRGGQFITE